ncbi:MAG: histidine phosphatase family protein [Actinomycetota bacterium]|nr:histidine phosphatase family protein [Actinomycetota bacterium]
MEAVILARHGESEFSARGLVSGDPAVAGGGLTAAGREQARELGRVLEEEPVELAVTSEFLRARETAAIALEGRGVPELVLPELNDIRFGRYEGGLLSDYREWARGAGPSDDCPGGGESRAAAAARFARAYRAILARPERLALVVCHGLPVHYAVNAAVGREPSSTIDPIHYAEAYRLSAAELDAAADRLERWAAEPFFV